MNHEIIKNYAPDGVSYSYQENGWIILHIEGSSDKRGYAHGYLLANQIENAIADASKLVYIQTGLEWEDFRNYAVKLWSDKINNSKYMEYKAEMQGIIRGMKDARDTNITYEDLLTWNGYEELTDYWFPTMASKIYNEMGKGSCQRTYKEFHQGTPDHCSAFIATGDYTKDGRIVVAHNCFTPYEIANYLNIIIDVKPESGYHFIMQAQPGFIHSLADYYESKAGLMITETTIGGFSAYDETGTPEFLRIRKAVQYAESMDDFVKYLWDGNNGGYANTWLVGDIKTNEIMRFELGLKFYKEDRTTNGAYAGFNAPLDPRIRNFECQNTGFADIRRHQGARQVRIPQLLEEYKGLIDESVAKSILADHYDVYLKKENPSSRTVCAHYELDDRSNMSQNGRPLPFQPRGAIDGIVATAKDAERMQFHGRYGNSCGRPFDATAFLKENPQFSYLKEFLKDRPHQEWTTFLK